MENIGNRIKARRKQLGMSAEKLADIIKVSPATIYRYESNYIMNMGSDKLESIASALHVTPAYLMGWEQEQIDAVSEIEENKNAYDDEIESNIKSFMEEFAEMNFSPAEILQVKMFMHSMREQEVKIDLGAAIKESRESKGMTKEQLAEMLEVPVEMVELYESSMSFPYEQMKKLNSILGISFYTMLGIPQTDASLYEKIYFLHLDETEMNEVYEYAKYVKSKRK